jgi:hypothetical protein
MAPKRSYNSQLFQEWPGALAANLGEHPLPTGSVSTDSANIADLCRLLPNLIFFWQNLVINPHDVGLPLRPMSPPPQRQQRTETATYTQGIAT